MVGSITRHLYVRIWLAVLAGVAVVTLAAGWAWQVAEEPAQRAAAARRRGARHARPRRSAPAQGGAHRRPGEPLEFDRHVEGRAGASSCSSAARRRTRAADRRRWVRPQTGFFWMLGMVGLAVAIGVYPIVRRLTSGWRHCSAACSAGAKATCRCACPRNGQDEVADLARRFNAAAARIETLVRSHKSLLANASHELRSPLTRIRMGLELMGERPSPRAQGEIARNIGELDQLIDEILLASRLDSSEADMGTIETVDLTGLAAEECARVDAELDVGRGHDSAALTCAACRGCCAARSATCWRTRAATVRARSRCSSAARWRPP